MPGPKGRFHVLGDRFDRIQQPTGLFIFGSGFVEKRSNQTTPDFFAGAPAVLGGGLFDQRAQVAREAELHLRRLRLGWGGLNSTVKQASYHPRIFRSNRLKGYTLVPI